MEDKNAKKKIVVGRSEFEEVQNPQAVEKKRQGRITWGEDDLYPHDLVAYRQDNPTHGGIIDQKVTYMTAAGADITGMQPDLAEVMQTVLVDAVDDFETFNGFSLLFMRSNEESTEWTVQHVDFESVRYCTEGNKFAISDDWSVKTQSASKTNYKEVKDIKFAQLSGDSADLEVLLYAKVKPKQRKLDNGKLSLCYYPVPNYISAIISILAGIEQDYFTYSESVNGYMGGTVISMNNGQPETEKEADKIADKIKDQATDRKRRGGLTILFSDGADNAATVSSMNGNDLDKRYIESNKEIRNKTMIGHQVGSPTLFAVNGESMFGSKEEMETAYALFSNNYVTKRQKFVSSAIEWAFGRLGASTVKITFRKYNLELGTQVKTENEKLSAKDPILVRMSKLGVERNSFSVVHSRAFDMQSSDDDFLRSVQQFDGLTPDQQLVLKLISEGKTFSEVAKALGKGAVALSLELIRLNAKGFLNGWKVVNPDAVNLQVRYSYEVKAGLGPTLLDTSREFCVDMVNLDRLYTRDEIDKLSNELDTDVWRYRGGWYTNPNTGKTTPSCRHEWKQNVVKKS